MCATIEAINCVSAYVNNHCQPDSRDVEIRGRENAFGNATGTEEVNRKKEKVEGNMMKEEFYATVSHAHLELAMSTGMMQCIPVVGASSSFLSRLSTFVRAYSRAFGKEEIKKKKKT